MSMTEPTTVRVAEIAPWFVPKGWEKHQFFRVTVNDKVGIPVVAWPDGLRCADHYGEADCPCRKAVRESCLLNSPVGIEG